MKTLGCSCCGTCQPLLGAETLWRLTSWATQQGKGTLASHSTGITKQTTGNQFSLCKRSKIVYNQQYIEHSNTTFILNFQSGCWKQICWSSCLQKHILRLCLFHHKCLVNIVSKLQHLVKNKYTCRQANNHVTCTYLQHYHHGLMLSFSASDCRRSEEARCFDVGMSVRARVCVCPITAVRAVVDINSPGHFFGSPSGAKANIPTRGTRPQRDPGWEGGHRGGRLGPWGPEGPRSFGSWASASPGQAHA